MNTSTVEIHDAKVLHLTISDDSLIVELSDGRSVSVPLAWYPRLLHGNLKERKNWRLIANGEGIHWEDLDEDISVENLLTGKPSGESQNSFRRWIEKRTSRTKASRSMPVQRTPQQTKSR